MRILLIALLCAPLGCNRNSDSAPKPNTPAPVSAKPAGTVVLNFDSDKPNAAPANFTTALSGQGNAQGTWIVRDDKDAQGKPTQVLAQTSTDNTNSRYPLCIYDPLSARDVSVTVSFKPLSGEVDQAAGIVARLKDKHNFYVVRANALEGNVRLYKMENNQRKQFAGKNIEIPANTWHTLGLTIKGSHFTVTLNGQPLFEADDETFKDPGKVALWTKADSVTLFDNLTLQPLDPK